MSELRAAPFAVLALAALALLSCRPASAVSIAWDVVPNAAERASFNDYVAAIDAGRPVIVTFCYDPSAASGLTAAKRREKSRFSAVGIGYMRYDDRQRLICRHGASSGSEMGPAANDCVSARTARDPGHRPAIRRRGLPRLPRGRLGPLQGPAGPRRIQHGRQAPVSGHGASGS